MPSRSRKQRESQLECRNTKSKRKSTVTGNCFRRARRLARGAPHVFRQSPRGKSAHDGCRATVMENFASRSMAGVTASIGALIADVEPQSRRFVRDLLISVGVTKIWEASDGETAFELYLQHQPAIVVLDVNMR